MVFSCNELNRKTETAETGEGPGGTVDYTYDPIGNVRTVQPQGELDPITYAYDNLNRLDRMDDQRPGTDWHEFKYDNQDHREKVTYPDVNSTGSNLIEIRVHNNDGNLQCVYSYRNDDPPSGTGPNTCISANSTKAITYQGYDYSEPGTSQPTSTKYGLTDLGGRTTSYEYDEIKRLTNATTKDAGNNNQLRRFQYDYDRHSNLTQEKATGTTPGLETGTLWSAFTTGDELCASVRQASDPGISCNTGPGQTSYAHDAAGNLTTATGGTGDLTGLALTYNLPGQTATIQAPGAPAPTDQAYDGTMQDRRTQSGPTSMSYGYSGLNKQATLEVGLDPAHTETFVRDPSGKLMAMITNTVTKDARYYLTDDQNSIIATTDQDTGDVIRYLYEPYGQTIRTWEHPNAGASNNDGAENASLPAPTTDNNPYGYVSGYTEKDTGLIKFGTRYYIPTHATWTQPDPEAGRISNPTTLNSFSYTGGNPINRADTTGRFWGQDALDATGEFVGDTLTEFDVWTGVVATAGASAALIGIGVGACLGTGGIACAAGAYLVGVGAVGLVASGKFAYEASKDAYDR